MQGRGTQRVPDQERVDGETERLKTASISSGMESPIKVVWQGLAKRKSIGWRGWCRCVMEMLEGVTKEGVALHQSSLELSAQLGYFID